MSASAPLDARTFEVGSVLLAAARRRGGGVFSSRFWSDQLMGWAMRDPAFKTQLFRFIDVMPVLSTPEQIHAHLSEYLTQPGVALPPFLRMGLAAGGMMKGPLAAAVIGQVESMAARFVAGSDAASALPALRQLWEQGAAFSVDLLGEACVSAAEADEYRSRYLDLIETLPAQVADFPANPVLERDHFGPVPRTNVSIKISSLSARVSPVDFEGTLDRLTESLEPVLQAAARHGVLVNFDMEQHSLKDLTLALFERCCERFDFPAGLAMQAYLRSGDADAERVIRWARTTGRQVTVRLIKGAYWDYETAHAEQMNWPAPVWLHKGQTDACFERMAQRFIEQVPTRAGQGGVKLAIGSHNLRSIALAIAAAEHRGLPEAALEFQMLRGMADELKAALIERGRRVREYVPVGQMIPGMAYLVRRLLENTSNESWLRAGFSNGADPAKLLAPPHEDDPLGSATMLSRDTGVAPVPAAQPGQSAGRAGTLFTNEPPRDFSDAGARERFSHALASAVVPNVANDTTIVQMARAIETAEAAFLAWRDRNVTERAAIVIRAAERLRIRRDKLAAVVLQEAAKPWVEADADVCEAIDFCEYYARQAVELQSPRRLGRFAGEANELWHEPRGVAAVISPWNFPLAICCGMTAAALVTGNTVVLKPAEQTPGVARLLCDALWDAGVPREALQFLPGAGETIGAGLVRDPRVATIAFTGSKAVGLDIVRAAGQTPEGQPFVKRVVCEMGGKNAIIVDASADVDEAVLGVRHSAFSYAGQKCSACSRAIVLADRFDVFLGRLVEASAALQVGDPREPGTDVGPLIDDQAAARVARYIELGKQQAKLELAVDVPTDARARVGKPLVGPHVFSMAEPRDPMPRIAVDEIFGPVLTVIRASDLDEALRLANASSFRLTGGLFSRTPSTIERVRREFRVGNLYVNRGITGALVGRQPFGGFGLSGLGSKAGGPDYLRHFTDPRACTENTMRRGFVPNETAAVEAAAGGN